jgi:hypothetical protein
LLGSIQPLPDGIQVETIKKDNKDDQCVTLVDVSRSEYPPHQSNGTYYIRLDGCNKPAPHAFVEALFSGRRPRYQQALIEHFEKKIANFRKNEKAMTALYFLVLERRIVPEPIIYAAVLGVDKMATERGRELREALRKLSDRGVLVSEKSKEHIAFGKNTYDDYMKHSINPDYQDLLADAVFERHRQEEFHLHNF